VKLDESRRPKQPATQKTQGRLMKLVRKVKQAPAKKLQEKAARGNSKLMAPLLAPLVRKRRAAARPKRQHLATRHSSKKMLPMTEQMSS
jgi:hypothetical protein